MIIPVAAPSFELPALVLIVGPIAGGKSTVARALTSQLRRSSSQVALVELDLIAAMALPALPGWAVAHSIFNSVVGQWLRSPLDVVVAEGPGNRSEVEGVLGEVPTMSPVVTVLLTSTFDVAFSRASGDETRGISRNREFLIQEFERWEGDKLQIEADVHLDTGTLSVEDCVAAISSEIEHTLGRGTRSPHAGDTMSRADPQI